MRAHRRNRLRASGAGQTMAEFAIIATALFLLVFGLMTLGTAVSDYNTMSNAAREAVRYAIVHSATSASPSVSPYTDIQNKAVAYAVGLNLTTGDNSTTGNVRVSWPLDPNFTATDPTVAKYDAKVTVSYTYNLKIPFMSAVALNFSSTSRMLESQ